VLLRRSDGDDVEAGFCGGCKNSPEAQEAEELLLPASATKTVFPFAQLLAGSAKASAPTSKVVHLMNGPREFTAADRSLIKRVSKFMSASQLLKILNERLQADANEPDIAYTLDQLQHEIAANGELRAAGGRDWPSLRKSLAKARRDGTLTQINEQVINDFAVVFQLNAKQVLELKDIVLAAAEED
jgi:hypothetical protein